MRQVLRKKQFHVTVDTFFESVIQQCQQINRPDQEGTWITNDMIKAYCQMHELGFAHSVEVWEEERLVGGLYGMSLGNMFFGESMFSKVSNASKVAFIYLVQQLQGKGFEYIDCQVENPHLLSLGAKNVSRAFFETQLSQALKHPTQQGSWTQWLKQ
jgi:leucyl/phenylalanyl-tRNA--protein transferase